ncbi:MAG TPA: hypothetical protein VNM14_11490 [Planctomycetota bacterium]|nr:hypothetical protein [Planctomycetota bacterium]
MRRLSLLIAAALLLSTALSAHEHAPRVLSPHNADAYSMKTFAEFPRWRDLKGDAKVYEVYKYLADRRTGIFPMGAGAWEGKDPVYDFGYIRDPVKMINVYSVGYCDMLGPTMAGVMKDMGVGPSRTLNLPGWGHVVAEVFYDGKWHYLDLDVRAAFRREDGTLASMEEAKKDDSLWKRPSDPLFFPLDNVASVRKIYAETPVQVRHGVNMGGHTMDYVLRRGETFTRWWAPQQDRWNEAESYHKEPHARAILEREPRGPKCKHPSFSIHTHGNGRFVYAPDLTDKSDDAADGVYELKNVKSGASGLVLETGGEGHVVFEVRSPYVIVPRVGTLETTDDDREASVLKLDAEGAAVSVSVDNGLTWSTPASADLTPLVSGRYGYLLKLALKGERAVVRSLELTTWVQVHSASLPSLRKGKNEMRYVTGDHYGLDGHVVEIRTNGSDRADFLKNLVEPPKDFDPARTTSRAQGPFVAKVAAPPGMKIAWFSGGGNFTTHQGDGAPKTKNTMEWAADAPSGFKEFYRAEVPAGQNHWHYNADVEVKLDAPAKTVFLRYVGDPGVNNLRIFAHCVEDAPPHSSPVRITHAWKEKGQLKTKAVTLEKPGPYEVTTEDEPADEYVELAVPTSRR